MNDNDVATVGELIAALTAYDPGLPVRVAIQPGYPMEHTVGRMVCTPEDAEGTGTPPIDPRVVGLGVGAPVGYLPAIAADALGWSR